MVMIVAILLNAMAPALAHAATYLQGAEINTNTLIRDAYVAVTYRDSNDQEKTEKGWIDAVGETSFTIRSGGLMDKKPIAYDKVLSVVMSDESTVPAKQMNEVNRFMREMRERETREAEQAMRNPKKKIVVVMARGAIDSAKIAKGWYAHVVYTSEGAKETGTGKIIHRDSDQLLIQNRNSFWRQSIAYRDIDTLLIAKYERDIERRKIDNISRQSRIVGKVTVGFGSGALLGMAGALTLYDRDCTGSWCGLERLLSGYIGYTIGVPIGVSVTDPHDRFMSSLVGSVMGGVMGIVLTASTWKLWPSLLICPIIGATIRSELTRKPPEARHFSVGLAPNSDGRLSAIATFRF